MVVETSYDTKYTDWHTAGSRIKDQEAQMWHVDDQAIETKECRLPKELSNRLGQASVELSAPQEEIIAQALREFLDKHGIQYQN